MIVITDKKTHNTHVISEHIKCTFPLLQYVQYITKMQLLSKHLCARDRNISRVKYYYSRTVTKKDLAKSSPIRLNFR